MSDEGFFQSRMKSIRIAWEGLRQVLRTQHNARIHAVITVLVVLAAGLLDLTKSEWISILVVIFFVWAAEIFNTAIEELVDLVSPEQNTSAKIIKDLSAGAVLVSAILAVIVGALIFGPRIWAWISG